MDEYESQTGRIYFIVDRPSQSTSLQIDVSAEIDIYALLQEFRGFLLAAGYHHSNVDEVIPPL